MFSKPIASRSANHAFRAPASNFFGTADQRGPSHELETLPGPATPLLKPFRGLRPLPHLAAEVIAPPFHALTASEARQRARDKALSFLNVSRAEIDVPQGTGAAASFRRMRAQGVFCRDALPCYYAYRLTRGTAAKTGIVAAASVAAYANSRIRSHELTQPFKVDDRRRYIEAIGAETEPVMLVHAKEPALSALVGAVTCGQPGLSVDTSDGTRHEVWVIDDTATITLFALAFEALPALYIADGHHRSAAAERLFRTRESAGCSAGDASHHHFLAVVFPEDEVEIMDYNRLLRDLGGLEASAFLDAAAERFLIAPAEVAVRPSAPAEFGLFLAGQWYQLTLKAGLVDGTDVSRRIPARLLHDHIFRPILGIADPGDGDRIEFVAGIHGFEILETSVRQGKCAAAFTLCPTSMADLQSIADAGLAMPPKSTWFEPKPADGLITYLLD